MDYGSDSASMNRGFGAGVNLGVVAGTREQILILNPDTYFVDSHAGVGHCQVVGFEAKRWQVRWP
jgi:hypothetical protein